MFYLTLTNIRILFYIQSIESGRISPAVGIVFTQRTGEVMMAVHLGTRTEEEILVFLVIEYGVDGRNARHAYG